MCRTAAAGAGPRRRRRAQVRTRRITAAGIMLPRGGRQSLAHAETASLRPQAVTHCSRASDRRRHGDRDLDCRGHHDGGSGDEPTATRRLTGGRLSSSSGPRLRNLRLVPRHAAGGRPPGHESRRPTAPVRALTD